MIHSKTAASSMNGHPIIKNLCVPNGLYLYESSNISNVSTIQPCEDSVQNEIFDILFEKVLHKPRSFGSTKKRRKSKIV